VNAWGFGPGHGTSTIELSNPNERAVDRLRQHVSYRLLEVDRSRATLTKRVAELSCDLSAIAKGYAVDSVAEELERLGYTDYMVEIGGEVRARGRSARREPWRIGIEKPTAARGSVHEVVTLDDQAMATSGSYRNFRVVAGKRLSHTIDPRSGQPVSHRLLSVSVVHERAARADALATALHVLGPVEGVALAEREGLAALFLIEGQDASLVERATMAFQLLRRRSRQLLAQGDRP